MRGHLARLGAAGALGLAIVAASFALPAPAAEGAARAALARLPDHAKVDGKRAKQLDPTTPEGQADIALVEMGTLLDDPATAAQLKPGKQVQVGEFKFTIATASATMDPGCDVTSSNPGGYDMCAGTDWPDGDLVSAWTTTTYQKCWAGIQERDVTVVDGWRAWAKCQFVLNGNVTAAIQDIDHLQVYQRDRDNAAVDAWSILGNIDPGAQNDCGACYWTGAVWRIKNQDAQGHYYDHGVTFLRNLVSGGGYSSEDVNAVCSRGMRWYDYSYDSASLCSRAYH